METRSKTSVSSTSAKNSGPGQGKYKAKVGNAIDLGLSSQSKIEGGSAEKLRDDTGFMTQRPKGSSKSVSSDRGKFPELC